ncbi:MAG: DUF4124 domain-containing protein [Methylococcales bacterium]
MKFTLILLFCLFSVPTHAGAFKCTNSNGKITYSSAPCIGGQKSIVIDIDATNTGTGDLDDHEEEQKPQELTPESNDPVLGQIALCLNWFIASLI